MSRESTTMTEGAIVNQVPVARTLVHDPSAPGHGYVRDGERLSTDLPDLAELVKWGSAEWVPADEARDPSGDPLRWVVKARVEKYDDVDTPGDSEARAANTLIAPDDVVEGEGNTLTIGGASALWERLIGTGITAFDNTNANLGVGDSSTAVADTQTDLQAASNKLRKPMDASYPTHTDSTGTAGSKSITYKSTYGTSDANWAWAEWALFNASASGRMLNRKAESLGTKTSSATWVLTITLSLA